MDKASGAHAKISEALARGRKFHCSSCAEPLRASSERSLREKRSGASSSGAPLLFLQCQLTRCHSESHGLCGPRNPSSGLSNSLNGNQRLVRRAQRLEIAVAARKPRLRGKLAC